MKKTPKHRLTVTTKDGRVNTRGTEQALAPQTFAAWEVMRMLPITIGHITRKPQ